MWNKSYEEDILKYKLIQEMVNDFNNTWSCPYWVDELKHYLTDELKI